MWIDDIYVNQRNLVERRQVKLMADIFSGAFRVVVWIGPEAQDSTHVLVNLQQIGSRVLVDWEQYTVF